MGRNAAIKNFGSNAAGHNLELFDVAHARLPVIHELLKSPWIQRASELARHDSSSATRRVSEDVTVIWDASQQRPSHFVRKGERYRIDAVIQIWASDRYWWDPRRHIARRYWRVFARNGIYDLAYDRARDQWHLAGIQD